MCDSWPKSTNPPEIRAHDFVMDTVLSPWTELGQGLVKRRADCTREQFSERWLKHAAKVTPWGLENGIKYYAQVLQALINLFCCSVVMLI